MIKCLIICELLTTVPEGSVVSWMYDSGYVKVHVPLNVWPKILKINWFITCKGILGGKILRPCKYSVTTGHFILIYFKI